MYATVKSSSRRWLIKWSAAGLVLATSACMSLSKSASPAMEEMSKISGVPVERLQRGHGIYLTQCGQCHELVKPESLKVADWRLVMPGMCWNAGLTRADEALLLEYVLAAKSLDEGKKKALPNGRAL
ncbi:MAG: hypothetical protein ACK49N_07560 [Verrucomicrobiota bacterium]